MGVCVVNKCGSCPHRWIRVELRLNELGTGCQASTGKRLVRGAVMRMLRHVVAGTVRDMRSACRRQYQSLICLHGHIHRAKDA